MILPLLLVVLGLVSAQNNVVSTTSGLIRGSVSPISRSFLGIPYAQAPVGALRFANPVEPRPWGNTIRNATTWGPACPQLCHLPPMVCPEVTSEDCLYMNVYTPWPLTKKFPVMVFIHGGHYDQGSAGTDLYDGYNFVNISQTILVSFNYRLGVLGFLATESGLAGNFAFFDQLLALKWVQANIAAFGGDPTQVTIFGESAGATSVAALLASPLSVGLYRGAIMQSNPFSIPLAPKSYAHQLSAAFAKSVKCEDKSTQIQCLRSKSDKELIAAQKAMFHLQLDNLIQLFLPWTPVIDANVIPLHILDSFNQGKWNKVPLIIGNDYDDAVLFIYGIKNASKLTLPEYVVVLGLLFGNQTNNIEKYYPALGILKDHRDQMSRLGTDYIFTCPNRFVAQKARSVDVPVWVYMWNHSLSWPGWGDDFKFCDGKSCHAVELAYEFSSPELHRIVTFTPHEKALSLSMIRTWANFAHTLDPNKGPFSIPNQPYWPQWTRANPQNLLFQTPNNQVQTAFKKAECDFWDSMPNPYHFGWMK